MYELSGAGGQIRPNDRHRILVYYGDQLCPILRFTMSADGSFNFSPYLLGATEVATQILTSDEEGRVSVNYGQGEVTATNDLKDKNPLKVNYHASGFIHTPTARYFASPLGGLDRLLHVGKIVFKHPREMDLIALAQVRKTDMVTHFKVQEDRPIYVDLTIAPAALGLPQSSGPVKYWHQVLLGKDLTDGVPDLHYCFTIREMQPGPWPPECGVLFPAEQNQAARITSRLLDPATQAAASGGGSGCPRPSG